MDLILNLTISGKCDVFRWLSLDDLVQLDTAVCNRVERATFLYLVHLMNADIRQNVLTSTLLAPFTIGFVNWLTKRGLNVESVTSNLVLTDAFLTKYKNHFGEKQTTLSDTLKNVKHLLHYCKATPSVFSELVSKFTSLESLIVKGYATNFVHYKNNFFLRPRHLKHLDLSECKGVSEISAILICRLNPSVEYLDFSKSDSLTGHFMHAATIHLVNLKYLNIWDCKLISTTSVLIFCLHNARLKMEHFQHSKFNDKTLRALTWYRGGSLTKLDIAFPFNSSGQEVGNLDGITSADVKNSSVLQTGVACPQLAEFSASNCPVLGDNGLVPVFTGAKRLKVVSLNALVKVTDRALAALVEHNDHTLRSLQLKSISLSPSVLETLVAFKDTLTRLVLVGMSLTDEVLLQLVNQCRLLVDVDVTNNKALTDAPIVQLVTLQPHILKLRFGENTRITNESLYAIADRCKRLTVLDFAGCKLIDDTAVMRVVEGCVSLFLVKRHNCPRITPPVSKMVSAVNHKKQRVWYTDREITTPSKLLKPNNNK